MIRFAPWLKDDEFEEKPPKDCVISQITTVSTTSSPKGGTNNSPARKREVRAENESEPRRGGTKNPRRPLVPLTSPQLPSQHAYQTKNARAE